jgi:serine/threonine protein phosphatase PrpC
MADAAPVPATPRFSAAGATDPGRVRNGNEDRLHLDAERGVFAVIDGVGGQASGEVAAAIAAQVIAQRLDRPLGTPARRVREAIALANNEILGHAQAAPEHAGMTCVLTLALVTDHGVTIGHVGDTRLYALTRAGIAKLTRDHSPIGEREDSHELTELEAMRHPRRNEVFRDVGSAFHEPDDPYFVEVIEAAFDEASALLLCSDGLSDMIPSTRIEQIVRQHAGRPARVVEALIAAANAAGGKDNVSAIYVEGARFARTVSAAATAGRRSTGDAPASSQAPANPRTPTGRSWNSRVTWLSLGALLGLTAGIGLAWMVALDRPLPRRPLVVGGDSPDRYATIGDAMAAASSGDLVIVAPGEYAEEVTMKDGVSLEARTPGTVALVATPERPGWVSLTAAGLDNRIVGLHLLGRGEAPIAVGLRLRGHGVQVVDVTIEGHVGTGADIGNDGDIIVSASRFAEIDGVPIRVGAGARPLIRQNVFVQRPDGRSPAAEIAMDASPSLQGNVFVGYADELNAPPALRAQLLDGNLSIPSRPRPAAAPRRTP